MSDRFKIGDKVEVIDSSEKGVVLTVDKALISVEFEDGFQQDFQSNQLILSKPLEFDFASISVAHIVDQMSSKKKTSKSSKIGYIPEIDLHIHELIDDASRLSNFEILNIQILKAKGFVEWAISKQIKKIVLIHGVGQGVLKQELSTLLRRYDNIEFFDANYQKYGFGATEVNFF